MSNIFPNREESKEKFVWEATYEDGAIIKQINQDQKDTSTEELSRKGLKSFALVGKEEEKIFNLKFHVGDKFAFRRRVAVKAGVGLQARYYIFKITRDNVDTVIWLNEETREVIVNRAEIPVECQNDDWYYPISEVPSDNEEIS
jgi:hypothetical protein